MDIRREADVEGPDVVEESAKKNVLSDKTISHWNEVFRIAVGMEMIERQKDTKIGGPGFEVEIDESCFGSMKYGRGNPYGHRQVWVLGKPSKNIDLLYHYGNTEMGEGFQTNDKKVG